MIGHDHISMEIVIIQLLRSVMDGCLHKSGDGLLPEIERSATRCIQVSVHPDEGLACVRFVRWRIKVMRKRSLC